MMENMDKIIRDLHLDTKLAIDDIPDLDLYMDQVIQLFEKKYQNTKRSPEEKILTKTMINNYSKGKLFFPIKNKKYSPEHVMLINLVYEMKTILAIRDIKETLHTLNERMQNDTLQLGPLYTSYLTLSENNLNRFTEDYREILKEVMKRNDTLSEEGADYLNEVLLILSFVNMSNYFRRAAEAIVDQIKSNNEAKKD